MMEVPVDDKRTANTAAGNVLPRPLHVSCKTEGRGFGFFPLTCVENETKRLDFGVLACGEEHALQELRPFPQCLNFVFRE